MTATASQENRETFFARLTPFMPPSELRKVEIAYMMAKFAHRAQVRTEKTQDGTPVRYFEHLRRVALVLVDELDIRDNTIICAALLHDTLEDTRDVTPEIIEHLFGPRVCEIVKLLSKCPKEGYFERLLKYGDATVALVKAADRIDNLRSMDQCGPDFVARKTAETVDKLLPFFAKFSRQGDKLSQARALVERELYHHISHKALLVEKK